MKKKTAFLMTLTAALLLTACGEKTVKYDPITDEDLIEKLTVINGDEIYGNIYLPSEVDGTQITWKSSKPDIISDTQIGDMEPGVVNRQGKDEDVTLTAIIEEDGVKYSYDQVVTVKEAPYEIEDEDYVGYLFGHFISEDGKQEGSEKIALGEQMYFAFADEGEGLHFKDLCKKNEPAMVSTVGERGVRDPYMMRSPEGDRFFMIATDLSVYTRGGWGQNVNDKFSKNGSDSLVLWESKDLVEWSESRLIKVALPDAGMAWAPEMIYHEETGQYVIFFASCRVNEDRSTKVKRDAIYYVTTRDFVHFSDTKLLIDNEEDDRYATGHRCAIDASIINIDGTYYSAIKDGDNNEDGGILIQKTDDLFNPESWEKVLDLDDTGLLMPDGRTKPTNQNLEGPEWFVYNQADRVDPDFPEYGLMGDQYMNQGAGYLPFATTDIEDNDNSNESWRVLKAGADGDYSWDTLTKRHGTIMRITSEECETIKEFYNL